MTTLGTRPRAVSPAGLVATAVRHEAVDPLAVFAAAGATGQDASLWLDRATGRSLVGVGVAVRLHPAGPARFECLGEAWRDLVADVVVRGPAADSPLAGPFLLGGAAFRDGPSVDPRWAGFGAAAFDTHQLLLASHEGETVLTTLDDTGVAPDPRGLERLRALSSRRSMTAPVISVAGLEPDHAAWSSSVARITGAVGRGRLDKVVLARRVDLRGDVPIDPAPILSRLLAADRADPTPGARLPSTVFAFARGGRTFLGSSPERLVSLRGDRLRTMALAGTTIRGADAAQDAALGAALLASEKDREEHAVVATMLRETLAPLVMGLELPRVPRIVRSARLQHLVSDVTATASDGIGLFDIVQRLHPTPAVGGWPTQAALELLDEESDLDRGWYAGPVGWIDRHGDGDISVGIRSGLIHGSVASLFAGCGIVADSEPDREWDESALKLRVMGDAIGWSGA